MKVFTFLFIHLPSVYRTHTHYPHNEDVFARSHFISSSPFHFLPSTSLFSLFSTYLSFLLPHSLSPPPHPGNGYHSLIDQDKFMSETWDHWFVGGDNSGDVMVWRNMVEMRSWVKEEMGDVHLVSSCLDIC